MEFSGREKKRALFIINPKAGVAPVNLIISSELQLRKNLCCIKTLCVDDTAELIRKHFDEYDVFVATGGDGTVHTVAEELIGTGKILAVLPVGSGNGFAREFGFRPNIRFLLQDITKGKVVSTDIIQINDKLCLNVAGIGLDSFVAHSFNKLKLRGIIPYIYLTLKTFWQLSPVHIDIKAGGEEIVSEDLFVLTVANTRQFGNNAFIAPEAVPNDGIMDIVMIRPFPKYMFLSFIHKLFTGNLNRSKYVRYIRTDKEVVINTDETRFHVDGEPVEMTGEIVINIRSKALNVLKAARNKRFWSTGS